MYAKKCRSFNADRVVHGKTFVFADNLQIVHSFKSSLLSDIEAKITSDISKLRFFRYLFASFEN